MNQLFTISLLAAFAAVLLVALLAFASSSRNPRRPGRFTAVLTAIFHAPHGFDSPETLYLANIGEGQHDAAITKRVDAILASRFLLVKIGSDANHVAIAGVADIPLGVATDEAAAIEDIVSVALFGANRGTLKVQASAAIAQGDFVVAAANGQVRTLPGVTGTYYIIGRALNAAGAAGDIVEIDPTIPIQRVVP